MDLVGTCPKTQWLEWLEEGDLAGEEPSGWHYEWQTRSPLAKAISPGDRFYVVAHNRLRGYAEVIRVDHYHREWAIVRGGDAIACTVPYQIPGFRGLRRRWWKRSEEHPFDEWHALWTCEVCGAPCTNNPRPASGASDRRPVRLCTECGI